MAKFIFLCFLLANTLLCHVMATTTTTNKPQSNVQSTSSPSSNAPSQSPFSQRTKEVESSIGRKLGKHQHNHGAMSPSPSPFEGSILSHEKTSVLDLKSHFHLVKHHHSFDRSMAGGGVILGGLATTFLVVVYCYIRATSKHKLDTTITTT
ncbi:uncharacterized protein LOC131624871 [Vicia villosa]|uniref:uncharacterized protein LOC131624871 n=1 Tax=Vicia villosa TaxID=3911 RepID=UPI00273C7F1E|nr:uncharacterized protein LOC131624871 [Vicia villosa]